MRSVFVTIALVVSFCTLAVTGTLAFVNHRASVAMSHAAQAENAAIVMDLLGAQLAGAVRFSRAEQITPQVDALVETSRGDATDVLVVSVTGDAMVALGSDEALAGLAGAAITTNALARDEAGRIAVPIRPQPGADPIGALAVRWTTARIDAEIAAGLTRALAVSGAIFATALLVAMLVILALVSRPLRRVTASMAAIADGNLDVSVPGRARRDEIGAIARTLSDFAVRLAAAAVNAREAAVKGAGFSASSAALVLLDRDGRVEHLSAGGITLLGEHTRIAEDTGLDQALGTTDLAPGTLAAAASPPESGRVLLGGRRLSWKLGEIRGDAERLGFIVELRDDTEQQRIAAVIDALDSAQARADLDLDLRIVGVNAGFAAAAGKSPEQLAGLMLANLFRPEGLQLHEVPRGLQGNSRLDVVGEFGPMARRLDGQIAAIRDDAGETAGYVLLARDVTDAHAKLAADRLREAEVSRSQQEVVVALSAALAGLSSGDLTARITTALATEYDQLRLDLNAVGETLSHAVRRVAEAATGIRGEIDEIAGAADELSRRTEQQAATLADTAARMAQMTQSVATTAGTTDTARETVEQTRELAGDSARIVQSAVNAMSELEASSHQISRITGLIHDIAFQTNLLALNAGVEAARAGEAGRGFAVVASEVRALAQRSSDAARDIADLIATSKTQVAKGVSLVGKAGASLETISVSIATVADQVSTIAAAATDQSRGLSEINVALSQLDQVTQHNTAMFEHTSAATQGLRGSASGLFDAVARFRTGTGPATERAPDIRDPARPVAAA
jgi:methyl-accepting chemotaxis protein